MEGTKRRGGFVTSLIGRRVVPLPWYANKWPGIVEGCPGPERIAEEHLVAVPDHLVLKYDKGRLWAKTGTLRRAGTGRPPEWTPATIVSAWASGESALVTLEHADGSLRTADLMCVKLVPGLRKKGARS